jgi:hypothetical protein
VTRFFCPPEIPLFISSPTSVSAQWSNCKICKIQKTNCYQAWIIGSIHNKFTSLFNNATFWSQWRNWNISGLGLTLNV